MNVSVKDLCTAMQCKRETSLWLAWKQGGKLEPLLFKLSILSRVEGFFIISSPSQLDIFLLFSLWSLSANIFFDSQHLGVFPLLLFLPAHAETI